MVLTSIQDGIIKAKYWGWITSSPICAWLCVWQSMKSEDLQERLEESEKLMKDMSKTWEQKLQETEQIHKVRDGGLNTHKGQG